MEDYSKVIDLEYNWVRIAEAYYNRAILYCDLLNYEKALEDFNKAIDLKLNDPEAYFYRGNTYHKLGYYDEALEDYDNAIALNPNYAEAYFWRGKT